MRGTMVCAALLLLAAGAAGAQTAGEPGSGLFASPLTGQEREQVRAITEETARAVREAQAEIQILKARLNKELLQEQVDMNAVERLVRQAMEWEVKARLARIRREVEIRKLLGDRRWAALMQRIRRGSQVDERLQKRLDELLELARNPRNAGQLDRALRDHLEELQRLLGEELRQLRELRGDL